MILENLIGFLLRKGVGWIAPALPFLWSYNMTFSFDGSSKNFTQQINLDVNSADEAIGDEFDERTRMDDGQFDVGDSEPDDKDGDVLPDDDSAPFDFDEEKVTEDEPDYAEDGSDHRDDTANLYEEEQSDDEQSSQDPDEIDQHDETDAQQETDVRREIDQEDDIDQTEETVISEPVFYPSQEDLDTDQTDEQEEEETPIERLDYSEVQESIENFPSNEVDEAYEFANEEQPFNPFELEQIAEDVAQEVIQFDYSPEEGVFRFSESMLEIDDLEDDVFVNILPDESMGDPMLQLFDNDFLDFL